jgi:hypothetical protein
MTQDEIIEMARQVARQPDRIYAPDEKEFLYYFAKLIAAKATASEREACAKVCDSTVEQTYISGYTGAVHSGKRACAAAIRARGQA